MVNFNFLQILKVHLQANSAKPDQMLHSAASDLVFTVCQRPTKRMLGLYGLTASGDFCSRKKLGLRSRLIEL